MRRIKPAFAILMIACSLHARQAHAAWLSVGACGAECATADQACADAAAFHGRALLGMYPLYSFGRLVGYGCDLDPRPINIGDSSTHPICDLITEKKDPTTSSGCVPVVQPRQLGDECGQAGNPITIVNGNKYLEATDFESGGYERLAFQRFYNSLEQSIYTTSSPGQSLLGTRWRTNWDTSISFVSTALAIARRADGKEIEFSKSQGVWRLSSSYSDLPYRLVEDSGVFRLIDRDDTVETFDFNGRLLSRRTLSGYTQTLSYGADGKLLDVTDTYGRALHFAYSGSNVITMAVPGSHLFQFEYQPLNNYGVEPTILKSVIYPDSTPDQNADNPRVIYLYEDSRFPQAVTGVIDEAGNRFATYTYDDKGRAITTMHGDGADSYAVAFPTPDSRTVTNPLGETTTYRYTTVRGIKRIGQVEGGQNCTCDARGSAYSYDPATGMIASRTDWNGNRTNYVYNSRSLQVSRTEAAGTPLARTITTDWHPDFRLPILIVVPGLTTTFDYDDNGRLLTITETDTTTNAVPYSTNGQQRTWTYTYNSAGQVETVDGPRTGVQDRTRYVYDGADNLTEVTNALGHVTRIIEHDPRGLPLNMIDPNGVTTSLTYNERRWLTSHSTGGATTMIVYDPVGSVTQITLPNGAVYSHEYDAAQRLTAIENNVGERIDLTLDAMGNVIATQVRSTEGPILYSHQQVFDALGRLLHDIGAEGQITTFGYDKNDNQTSGLNARQFTTASAFDALDRLYRSTDALGHDTNFAYDSADNLAGVTDPRGISTGYVYNGFGELIHESSPDGGNITYVRDSAGNIVQRTDGRGVVTLFTYDALNRRITETFRRSPSENRRYIYDNPNPGEHGIGRLHRILDDSGSTTYVYDARGNVISNRRFIRGIDRKGVSYETRYVYDLADQVVRLTYPSGRVVDFTRDTLGRVTGIATRNSAGGLPVSIASSITYNPFGAVTGWTYGNAMTSTRSYDLDYRPTALRVSDGAIDLYHVELAYDPNGNVAARVDLLSVARSQTFDYDALDRLVQASSGAAGDGIYGVQNFDYDAVGNRIARSGQGESEIYNYSPTSNRLNSISQDSATVRQFAYDAAGNVVQDDDGSARRLVYNHAGRYTRLEENGAAVALYRYNALGERVMKGILPLSKPGRSPAEPANTASTHYHYDLDRSLIAETTAIGGVLREYIYLPQASGLPLLLAQIDTHPAKRRKSLFFVIGDHLNTPIVLVDSHLQVAWRRTQTPFGETVEEHGLNPMSLRFPGQYFDRESGYHYNSFRDYDPSVGKYIEPDPIGLLGGIRRYDYAAQNPTLWTDFLGLTAACPPTLAAMDAGICYPSGAPEGFKRYSGDESRYHCGGTTYLEYRSEGASSLGDPAAECVYDSAGGLIDRTHPYSGCQGTADQYPVYDYYSPLDFINHILHDIGGPLNRLPSGRKLGDVASQESDRFRFDMANNPAWVNTSLLLHQMLNPPQRPVSPIMH